jgi:hypothetical protein
MHQMRISTNKSLQFRKKKCENCERADQTKPSREKAMHEGGTSNPLFLDEFIKIYFFIDISIFLF